MSRAACLYLARQYEGWYWKGFHRTIAPRELHFGVPRSRRFASRGLIIKLTAFAPSSHRTRRLVTIIVAAVFFMEMLDSTVIVTALPQMGLTFAVSPLDVNLGITAYLLALAVFIPISGWIADRFGARTVFCAAIAIFTLASFLCGISKSLRGFAAARLLQGAGGAAMFPVGRLIVLRMTDKKDLMRVMGAIIWPGLAAPVVGPPLGGFLVTHFSWPWIFFVNLPLGAVAIAVAAAVPNTRQAASRTLDIVGFMLTGAAAVLTVFGADTLGNTDGSPVKSAAFVLTGILIGFFAFRHLKRHPHPILDLRSLRLPTYSVGILGGSVSRMTVNAVPFLLPLMFQLSFGLDAYVSGLLVLCVFAGNLAMKLVTSPIIRRFGFRNVLVVNGGLVAISLCCCGLLRPSTPLPVVVFILFAGGAFRSLQFTAFSTLQFADVPPDELTAANTLSATVTQLAFGAGIVVAAVVLNGCRYLRGNHSALPQLGDFQNTFFVIAALALLSIVDCYLLERSSGQAISGHRSDRGRRDTAAG